MVMIVFIGLGNMGLGMVVNLVKVGYDVKVFDLFDVVVVQVVEQGVLVVGFVADVVFGVDVVVIMLFVGKYVCVVYEDQVFLFVVLGMFFLDCFMIDVDSVCYVGGVVVDKGFKFVDVLVFGGVVVVMGGMLIFMVGGFVGDFVVVELFLQVMGKVVIYVGDIGVGQVVKICNNMLLVIIMIGMCEVFVLVDKLGFDQQKFFDILFKVFGQFWFMISYCLVLGLVLIMLVNNDY